MTLLLVAAALLAGECPPGAATLAVDPARSRIQWRGTKFFGLGSHEGTVRIGSGRLCLRDEELVGGTVTATMGTIEVTDIPEDDPIPRNRLREHLRGEDFFFVERHPEARLEITSATREKRGLYRVRASLTLRGRTEPIEFFARASTVSAREVRAEARFKLDRHRWGVSYRGSTIRDDLVDDLFELAIALEARS